MYKTKNDLPEERRKQVIDILAQRLADCADLQLQAKQAHWNVKGPSFIALHELFDKVADTAEESVDLIAERIVQLGGIAEGTVRVAAQRSTLAEYPLKISIGKDHVDALSSALAAFGTLVRSAIDHTALRCPEASTNSSGSSRLICRAIDCRGLVQPSQPLTKKETHMRYRLLGNSGLRVSEAAPGTMTFGDDWGRESL